MIRFVLLPLLLIAVPLGAQADPRADLMYPLQQRVRVAAPTFARAAIDGRVATVDSTHLALVVAPAGSTLAIPLAGITSIEAYGGRDRRRGVKRGALVGLALGTYFFIDTYPEIREGDYWGFGFLVMSAISFGITPAIGAAAGYAMAPHSWSPLTVPVPQASASAPLNIRFTPDEVVRLHTRDARLSGRVRSQTRTLVTVTTSDATVPVPWSDVSRVQVRGGKDRVKGATAGALLFIGLGILGEQTAPTTSTGERIGAFTGATIVGAYLGSRFLAPRGWSDLPVPPSGP